MKKLIVVAGALVLLLSPFAASAQSAAPGRELTPEQALTRVLSAPSVASDWLNPSFTASIPASRLSTYIERYKDQLGAFERVVPGGERGEFLAVFERGTLPALISIDDQGRIIELLFRVPQPFSLPSAIEGLSTLPGSVGYLVTENGKQIAAGDAEHALAVGSPKLAVLAAVQSEIARGQRRWNEVERLQPSWKSLPPGILQDWPAGSELTLDTLASLMMSLGDNTATDALIHLSGGALNEFTGTNEPFLTTRDAFVLESRQNTALLDQWRQGGSAQRGLVAELERAPLPASTDVDAGPANVDVGWRYNSRQLCDLMERVQSLPAASIDPGQATPSDWMHVAYAGSANAGAISMTSWLVSKNGTTFCASATWNAADESVNAATFSNAYLILIASLRAKAAG